MASRKKKKPTRKSTRKTIARSKKKAAMPKKAVSANKAAHWEAYKRLQKRVDKAWTKLQADVRKKAPINVLIRNKNQLLLLLGECNYMARECMRSGSKAKSRR